MLFESEPRFATPRLVQRLVTQERRNNVTFARRFRPQPMQSPEFYQGQLQHWLRRLQTQHAYGEVMIDGVFMSVFYHPEFFNRDGVITALTQLYFGNTRTQEPTYFDQSFRRWRVTDADAWFDIEHGLFWSWRTMHPGSVLSNIHLSVLEMDQPHLASAEGLKHEVLPVKTRRSAFLG